MKPTAIYFPFTYISDSLASSLYACVGKTVVYQPTRLNIPLNMKNIEKQDIIEIRHPLQQDDDNIAAIFREYKHYADLYDKQGVSALKYHSREIPFFSSTSPHKVRDEIQGYLKKKAAQESSPGITSRIFLQLAQEFDQAGEEMEKGLQTIELREKALVSELKGEITDRTPETTDSDDIGGYLPKDRLTSWTTLMQNDPDLPALFVTSSQAVWDDFRDQLSDAEMIYDHHEIKINPDHADQGRSDLTSYIHAIHGKPWPQTGLEKPGLSSAADGKKLRFSLLIVPHTNPYSCFTSLYKGSGAEHRKNKPDTDYQHTCIALVMPG